MHDIDIFLFNAIKTGNIEDIQAALERGASVHVLNEKGYTPLMCGVMENKPEVVDILIKAGADVNKMSQPVDYREDPKTPLMMAAYENNDMILGQLLLAGADPDIKTKGYKTARTYAVERYAIACSSVLARLHWEKPFLPGKTYKERLEAALNQEYISRFIPKRC